MKLLLGTLTQWIQKNCGSNQYAIVMIGNSGSGKSTLAKELSKALGIKTLCVDEIRKELTGDELDQDHNTYIWGLFYKQAYKLLHSGKCVIVDATNAKAKDRRKLVDRLKEHCDIMLGIWVDTPIDVCISRNQNRPVPRPEHAIERMGYTLSVNPPTIGKDGFSAIWRVDIENQKDWV